MHIRVALRKEVYTETRQPLQYQGLVGFSSCIFPYIFPLQIQNVLHEALHAGGAVLLHAFGEVAVFVQRESCGCVAHVGLYRFYIVPGPDRVHGVGVAQVCQCQARTNKF